MLAKAMDKAALDATNKGIDAAGQMLQWRIVVLSSEQAKDPKAKKAAEDEAENILLKLRKDRPELASKIDQQLINRMPADRPIDSTLQISQLLALLRKAMIECYKVARGEVRSGNSETGIETAREIVRRQGREGRQR